METNVATSYSNIIIRTFQLSEHPLVLTCLEKWLPTVDPLSNWSWSDPLSDNQQGHRTMAFNVLNWFGNANKSHVISRVIVLLAFLVCTDRDIKSGSSWVERHKAKKKLQLHMCGSPLGNRSLAIQLVLKTWWCKGYSEGQFLSETTTWLSVTLHQELQVSESEELQGICYLSKHKLKVFRSVNQIAFYLMHIKNAMNTIIWIYTRYFLLYKTILVCNNKVKGNTIVVPIPTFGIVFAFIFMAWELSSWAAW